MTNDNKDVQEVSNNNNDNNPTSSNGVIVIGAGAAGLTAAYDLKRKGIPVQLLEAHSEHFGGRVRKLQDFVADYPIDVGGEFIHFHPKILQRIVDDSSVDVASNVKTKAIQFAPFYEWRKHGEWRLKYSTAEEDEVMWKFVLSTWHDFFAEYIVPTIQQDIHYGCVVNKIDYNSSNTEGIIVTCEDGRTFQASQVIVAVSLPILQQKKIQFNPPLPLKKQSAIEKVTFEPGFKVFMEFSQKFYYQNFGIYKKHKKRHGEMYFYDESALNSSKKKESSGNTKQHILGVFVYGDLAQKYVTMSDEEILQTLLAELDEAYKGRATRFYMKGFVQNWCNEPYIQGTYSSYRNGMAPMYHILQPVGNNNNNNNDHPQIFFAGEHLAIDGDYGYVTGAAFSGRSAANAVECVRQGKKPPFPWRIWLISVVLGTLCCGLEHFLFFRDM